MLHGNTTGNICGPLKQDFQQRCEPLGRRTVVVERDASEFARLSQLGDVLGLSPLEVSSVHSQLAEQAYRNQVQSVRACALVAYEV